MRLRNRFLLVGLGVVLFLITTPFLVLYARGFKIDWENKQFVKTGTLVVKTEPSKADIYLNDEKHDSDTPANLRFLLPGDYNIRVEKENYQSWTKRLSVKPQLVTWTNSDREFIALFLKLPKLEKTWSGTNVILSEENDRIFIQEKEQLKRINVDNAEATTIETLPAIVPVDTRMEITRILSAMNIAVPSFSNGKIIRTNTQIYLILDNTLYLANESLEKIYSPVNHTHWNERSKSLLFSNDNEIYIYYTEWNEWDLILRSLTQIRNSMLNPETGYVIFQNESKVKAIELDGRDHRNIFTIADASDNFVISNDGKKLYILSAAEIKQYLIR